MYMKCYLCELHYGRQCGYSSASWERIPYYLLQQISLLHAHALLPIVVGREGYPSKTGTGAQLVPTSALLQGCDVILWIRLLLPVKARRGRISN